MKMKSIRLDFAVEGSFAGFGDGLIKQSLVDAVQEHMRARELPVEPGAQGTALGYVNQRYASMPQEWRDRKTAEIEGKLALGENVTRAIQQAEVSTYEHDDLHPSHVPFNDAAQEIMQALDSDLETGTHHGNNSASAAFAKRYPRLIAAINQAAKVARGE